MKLINYTVFFLLEKLIPAKPNPSKARDDGSGTDDVFNTILSRAKSNPVLAAEILNEVRFENPVNETVDHVSKTGSKEVDVLPPPEKYPTILMAPTSSPKTRFEKSILAKSNAPPFVVLKV